MHAEWNSEISYNLGASENAISNLKMSAKISMKIFQNCITSAVLGFAADNVDSANNTAGGWIAFNFKVRGKSLNLITDRCLAER